MPKNKNWLPIKEPKSKKYNKPLTCLKENKSKSKSISCILKSSKSSLGSMITTQKNKFLKSTKKQIPSSKESLKTTNNLRRSLIFPRKEKSFNPSLVCSRVKARKKKKRQLLQNGKVNFKDRNPERVILFQSRSRKSKLQRRKPSRRNQLQQTRSPQKIRRKTRPNHPMTFK